MYRVVQWGAGLAGGGALEGIIAHPDLELVGVRVYRDEKHGRDAGELIGQAPIGVKATNQTEEILALDADCVVYMADKETDPFGGLDDICALLASGKNVVSTAVSPLIYAASMGPEVVERIEKACAEGQSSFHGTGIEPGWAAEVLPLTMSGLNRRIDSILVQELLDYASWDNAEMLFTNMGFGLGPDEEALWSDASVMGQFFHAPIMLVADGLGATIERFEYHRDVWLAEQDFDIAAGSIKQGTVAAMKFGATAIVDGRPALTVEHVTRLTQDAAPEWANGQGWRVTIEGLPSMMMEAHIGLHGEDHNDQACLATGMHAVHTVIPLCEADPGIRTVIDMRMVIGRHALNR
jgi:hypothetical protein